MNSNLHCFVICLVFHFHFGYSDIYCEIEVQSQFKSPQRLKKWYLIPPCLKLSTQVRIKGKVEQSRGGSSALPYTLL